MNYRKLDLSQKLTFIKEAITISLSDSSLSEPLSRFGVTADYLHGGLALQEEMGELDRIQQAKYGKRIQLTAQVDVLYDKVVKTLRKDRAIVLTVLKDSRGIDNQLGLKGRLKTNRERVMRQGRNFYNELLTDQNLRLLLEPYNFSEATIQARLADIDALADAMTEQQVKRAEAIIATRKRENAMAVLDNWTAQFIGIARQTFREDKKQLEKLGIGS